MNKKPSVRLREHKVKLGTFLSIGSPVIAELAAGCGFDWLLLDMEHGFGSEESLFAQLLAIRGTSAVAIVRVGAPHPDLILRVLDRGADGIMIPHISGAGEAEACVQAAHYPPRGRRGYSRSTRSMHYGLCPEPSPPPVIMAQIETIEGVRNARAIAAVDGVDVLFVGPADLNFDLQSRPGASTDDYAGCLAKVAAAAAEHGKQCGILVRNAADIESLRKLKYTMLAIDSDLGILRTQYQAILKLNQTGN
jgi:2-dehydro-3-deoxyglucarate aldolase/4-hydroxy-2-oxoheptanedioate aldolase